MATATEILERVKVREVAGVIHSRDLLDAAVSALLSSGFDRADIDVMVGAAARERVGGVKIAVEELPEVPVAPRQPVIAREDVVLVWFLVLSILVFAGAGFSAWLVVRSGEELIWAGIAAAVGAVAAGLSRSTPGSRACTQAHQASRSSVDDARARPAGARSLGGRRGEGHANPAWPWRASGSHARDHNSQAFGAPTLAFVAGRPVARRRTSGPSRGHCTRGAF